MKAGQVCAYANWPDESFEVWKWCKVDKPVKDIVKEMQSLFLIVFSKVVRDKALDELDHASRTVGKMYAEIEVPDDTASTILHTARFARFRGKCLDKERLQYFARDKVLAEGSVIVQDNDVAIEYQTPRDKNLSGQGEQVLTSRQIYDDGPKPLEADILRLQLGQDSDSLFEWKEHFHVKLGDHANETWGSRQHN